MAIPSARWRPYQKLAVAFLAIAFSIVLFIFRNQNTGPQLLDEQRPVWIDISYVQDAAQEGAVCLDGSPPAYHLDRGSGSGSRNWLVFLEGGGWCRNEALCRARSSTPLGSSAYMEKRIPFGGILSQSPSGNPDFYNWNRVKVRYCDGASFGGNVKETGSVMYRGQRIWKAVIRELRSRGMHNAEKALLAGCSAGGLATILHCDDFRSSFGEETTVKCLSDAGFFLDGQNVRGNFSFRSFYKDVYDLQNLQQMLPEACTSKLGAMCLFPQYLQSVQSPLFIVNPGYDTWQIQNILAPNSAEWTTCKQNLPHCSGSQLQTMHEYRAKLVEAVNIARQTKGWGLFIDSCFAHCQTENERTWIHTKIGDKGLRDAVGDWYYDRSQVELVDDCDYPCNPSCTPWVGWKRNLYRMMDGRKA